jgi:hypothetical protein
VLVPKVLVAGATLQCSHGGRRQVLSGSPKLEVAGNAVVTAGMETGLPFAPGAPGVLSPCPILTPSGAPSPCAATVAATAGFATRLTVGGAPALLDTASGQTINVQSPGTWSVSDAGQTKLEAT